jgi:hypothetical protein
MKKASTPNGSRARAWRHAALLLAVLSLTCAAGASAQDSGQLPGYVPGSTTLPTSTATLLPDGRAMPPPDAPVVVQNAIRAGNRIHKKPYIWGGGHRRWKAKGYDCSGAVSYALHAAGLLSRPLVSGLLATSWGAPGIGTWITVYANKAHTYAVIAGLRFDTSAVGESLNQGRGPRWRTTLRSGTGYAARYYPGF